MTVSHSPTDARFLPLVLCLLLLQPNGSTGSDKAETAKAYLQLNSCREESLKTDSSGLSPSDGNILVCGTFNDSTFSVESISQIRISANGRVIPITVDRSTVASEFDKIISAGMYFQIPATTAPDDIVLEWGAGINESNSFAENISVNPAASNLLRSFNWSMKADGSGDSSIASIEVIADSYSNYHSLWYIVPMAVIFAILTLRKHTSDK